MQVQMQAQMQVQMHLVDECSTVASSFEPTQALSSIEVSPPFDASSNTAFLGVSVMFELLCQMVN